MGSAPASLADNPFLITLLLEMQTTIFLRTEMSRKTEYVHNPCFLSANILKILGVFAENQKTLFSDIEIKVEGDQVVLNITSNINKEDKILNADLQISYSTINGIKVEKIPLIIDKGKLTFVYKIHSEQNPFILPAEGGRFESPFTCKKQTYLNGQFIEETYSSLNGLRFKTISSGNVWFLTVRKDGEKIGFYKFSFVGEGPYNQKTDPECYFNIYTHDADLITDNPTEIFRQDFIQPQTPGEDYYKPSRSSYKHGTFDF